MNRCPACRSAMTFFGIRPERRSAAWERWDGCRCGTFVVSDAVGHRLAVTREEPARGYFNVPA